MATTSSQAKSYQPIGEGQGEDALEVPTDEAGPRLGGMRSGSASTIGGI